MSYADTQEDSDKSHAASIRRLGDDLNSAIKAAERDGLSVEFTTRETKGSVTTIRIIDDWQFNRVKLGSLLEDKRAP